MITLILISPMLSSRSFILLCFIYRSIICEMCKVLHMDVQMFQNHVLRTPSFLHLIAFTPLSKVNGYICMGLFLVTLFCSVDLYAILLPILCCLNYCRLTENQDIEYCHSFNFLSFFCSSSLFFTLASLGLLLFYIHFTISFSGSTK